MHIKKTLSLVLAAVLAGSLWAAFLVERPASDRVRPHDGGLLNELFNVEPAILTDCAALRSWLQDRPNAFVARYEHPEYRAELHYRPAACTFCLEHPDGDFSGTESTKRLTELASSEQYVLRIATRERETNVEPHVSPAEVVRIEGTDTVPCVFVHHEPPVPGVPFRTLLLGFDRSQSNSDRTILIRSVDFPSRMEFILPKGGPSAISSAVPITIEKSSK